MGSVACRPQGQLVTTVTQLLFETGVKTHAAARNRGQVQNMSVSFGQRLQCNSGLSQTSDPLLM